MNMISQVPGRIRLRSVALQGSWRLCRHVEDALAQHGSVREAAASHRTGLLLITYHPDRVEPHALVSVATHAIHEKRADLRGGYPTHAPKAGALEPALGEFVRQAAWAGLRSALPAPWNALLPVAAQLMRRGDPSSAAGR